MSSSEAHKQHMYVPSLQRSKSVPDTLEVSRINNTEAASVLAPDPESESKFKSKFKFESESDAFVGKLGDRQRGWGFGFGFGLGRNERGRRHVRAQTHTPGERAYNYVHSGLSTTNSRPLSPRSSGERALTQRERGSVEDPFNLVGFYPTRARGEGGWCSWLSSETDEEVYDDAYLYSTLENKDKNTILAGLAMTSNGLDAYAEAVIADEDRMGILRLGEHAKRTEMKCLHVLM